MRNTIYKYSLFIGVFLLSFYSFLPFAIAATYGSGIYNSGTYDTAPDTTAPSVTAFSIPTTSSSLTVSITTFTATDAVGVTGYLLTETSSTPSAGAAGWTASAPANYIFSSQGVKTLYAWAKDATGNVSAPLNDTVTITLPDTTAPTVTAFSIPTTSSSLTVSITTFTATDASGVTGYLLTETSSTPSAGAAGWTASAPANYVFSSAGSKTLYAWAKDAAGNVSAPLNDTVTITLPDTTAPTVTAFNIPTTASSLTVSVSTFTATDAVGVTGYLLTETSSTPSAGAAGWTASAPASYVFSSQGSKTLYAWAKDAAGNVSAPLNDTVTITLPDTTAPTVTAFSIPTTSSSLTVSITTFTATDASGVTGYLLTETSSTPSAGAAGWTASAPASYTFGTAGSKTLYAWAKDAAGNVSTASTDTIVITLADTTVPTITAFNIPTTASSLTVSVSTFTATDAVGVTGYLLTETSSTPAVNNPNWASTAPNSYTFASQGSKTLYAWAKDAAGNVSTASTDTIVITLADTTAPSVTAFNIPTTSSSLTVSITTFTATDASGVTGYLLTEISSTPSAGDLGWVGSAPTSYTFSSQGSKTLYAWTKDGAGNVSSSSTDTVTITIVSSGGGGGGGGGGRGNSSSPSVTTPSVDCLAGALFSPTTGQKCTVSSAEVVCKTGEVFSTTTGQRCTSFGSSSGDSSGNGFSFSRTIKLTTPRMTGNDIKELQTYLKNNGYNVGTPDGVFGTGTKSAVMQFQASKGLTADGAVGPKTASYMNGGQTVTPTTPTIPVTYVFSFSRTLKLTTPRMTGNDIKELQTYLKNNGYNVGTPDGVFGTGTKSAVMQFQASKGLTADGAVGPKTAGYMK